MRIEGWNQGALEQARIGVVGDEDLLASMFILSASALGINELVVIAPVLDGRFVEMAGKVNPRLSLTHLQGFYTHPALDDLFGECNLFVDLSHYGLANKLLLEKAFREKVPLVRGFCFERKDRQGFHVFTYMRGREWRELERIVSPHNLPGKHFDDAVLNTVVAGIVLEEAKSILMHQRISQSLIGYERDRLGDLDPLLRILIVGAGALGNFVGLGLACSGYRHCTFMDPDVVELTNLNRQVLFHDALGRYKAEVLSRRLNLLFGMKSTSRMGYFLKDTDLSPYDVVFDCVDNFETRIVLSEECKDQRKKLISGGTSAHAGQVVVYDPTRHRATPAELLGLSDIVSRRGAQSILRERAACTYTPDPSVIMTNQIAAGFMVDSLRMLQDGQEVKNIFYDSSREEKI